LKKEIALRIVVKMGGSLLTETGLLHRIIAQLAEIQDREHEVIVVHGGGKQIKHYLEQLGIPSQFHNGLRVTDSPTMEVVQMVVAGLVNKNIVSAFAKNGRSAVGLCGGDGNSFVARKFVDVDGQSGYFDYGFVGEVVKGDSRLVNVLLARRYFPVIACIGVGEEGAYYNVNADEMAAAVAIFCGAKRLIFLTDVSGVLDAENKVIHKLNRIQIEELRSLGVISQGMLPKTRACERALENGIDQINILGGQHQDCLTRVLLQHELLGTAIVH
jgi:acetylglutamate kinase